MALVARDADRSAASCETLQDAAAKIEAAARHPARAAEHFARMVAALGGPADFLERRPPSADARRSSGRACRTRRHGRGHRHPRASASRVVELGGGRRARRGQDRPRVGFTEFAGLGDGGRRRSAALRRPCARTRPGPRAAAARCARPIGLGGGDASAVRQPIHERIGGRLVPCTARHHPGPGFVRHRRRAGCRAIRRCRRRHAWPHRRGLRRRPRRPERRALRPSALPNLARWGLGRAAESRPARSPRTGASAHRGRLWLRRGGAARARTRRAATGRSPAAGAVRLGLFPADAAVLPAGPDPSAGRASPGCPASSATATPPAPRSSQSSAKSISGPASRSATPRPTACSRSPRTNSISASSGSTLLRARQGIARAAQYRPRHRAAVRRREPRRLPPHRQPPRLRHAAAGRDVARSRHGCRRARSGASARSPTSSPIAASRTS